MILFLLFSIPLAYLFLIQFLPDRRSFSVSAHRVLRNPFFIGGGFFFLYIIVEFVISPLFELEYTWSRAFFVHTVFDLLLPFAAASVVFFLLYAKTLKWEASAQRYGYQSFFLGFFLFFPIQDLVNNINELGAVDVFLRPLGRLAFFVMLPWGLELLRNRHGDLKVLILLVLDGLFLLFASGASIAFASTGSPVLSIVFALPVLAHPILVTLVPVIAAGFRLPLTERKAEN